MIPIVLAVVGFGVLVAELWTGLAVLGGTVVHRAERPGQYWFTVALHAMVVIGLPLLAFFALGEFRP